MADFDAAIEHEHFSRIARYKKIDAGFLETYVFGRDDIKFVIQGYLKTLEPNQAPDYDHLKTHIDAGIYEMALLDEYKKVKKYFFENSQETLFNELNKYEEETAALKTENKELTGENIRLKEEKQKLLEELEIIREKIAKAQRSELAKIKKQQKKEIGMVEAENKKMKTMVEESGKELEELRRSLFKERTPESDVLSLEEAIAILSQTPSLYYLSSADFGLNKIKAIKDQLPTINYYADKSTLPDKGIAFVDWQLMSHKNYYLIIDWLRKKKIPYHFIQATGVVESIKEMAEFVDANK
jgi:hypothetical protein